MRTKRPAIPRGVAVVVARRFGDRLVLDVFYVPLLSGVKVAFLGMLDDASLYHQARHCSNLSSACIIQLLQTFWFGVFGPPDEVVVDAASNFLSEEFGQWVASWGSRVRPIGSEAHWQLGKAAVHGATIKYIYTKTADDFPSCTP